MLIGMPNGTFKGRLAYDETEWSAFRIHSDLRSVWVRDGEDDTYTIMIDDIPAISMVDRKILDGT